VRRDGIFIAVEVDDRAAGDSDLARRLTEACPVDIFAQGAGGALELVEGNLDECVLCGLCLDAAGRRGQDLPVVKIIKLYDDGSLLA
jgi:NAD-dependent dihydropyrimidine dehydrogenase PreA subunit